MRTVILVIGALTLLTAALSVAGFVPQLVPQILLGLGLIAILLQVVNAGDEKRL